MMQLSRLSKRRNTVHTCNQLISRGLHQQHGHHSGGKSSYWDFSNYLKWLGGTSCITACATMVRYMEPKTTTTFSDKFENDDGDILNIVHTGYHKWRSQIHKSAVFLDAFADTFKPHFSYAVYRKKYSMDEALELERQNLDIETYELITSNDFPYHYNRAKKRREDELKLLRDTKWEKASPEERRKMYDEFQAVKKRERAQHDIRRKRRGVAPKAIESTEDAVTEISEKNAERKREEEVEEYLSNRDEDKQKEVLLELMESDEAMNNLYIFHIKFLMDWMFTDFYFVLLEGWNDFGLLNFSTHTEQTLAMIELINGMENKPKIHGGDELLIVVNEPKHELQVYHKDTFIPIGYDGSSKHISQKNKQRQHANYEKYIAHCDAQPFRLLVSIKTDLLSECMKQFFLQNSKIAKVTAPEICEIRDANSEFERIKQKYGL